MATTYSDLFNEHSKAQDEWKRQSGVTMQGSGTSAAKDKKDNIEQENRKHCELMDFLQQSLDNAKQILTEIQQSISKALSQANRRQESLQEQLNYHKSLQQAQQRLAQGCTLDWEQDENGDFQLSDQYLRTLVDKWKDKNPNSTLDTYDDAFVLALINQELPTLPSQNDLLAAIDSQKLVTKKLNGLEQDRQELEVQAQNIDNATEDEKKSFIKDVNQKEAEVQKIVAESDHVFAMYENGQITGEELKTRTTEIVENVGAENAYAAASLNTNNTAIGSAVEQSALNKQEEQITKANDSYNDFSF